MGYYVKNGTRIDRQYEMIQVATIAERDALNILEAKMVYVEDIGDGTSASYLATSTGVGASYVQMSSTPEVFFGYDNTKEYPADTLMVEAAKLYHITANIPVGIPADVWADKAAMWTLLSETTDVYVDGATFDAPTMVLTLTDNDGVTPDVTIDLTTLRSVLTDNGDRTFDHDDGNGLIVQIDANTYIPDHDPLLAYKANNPVLKDGVLYRCKVDIAAKAWDVADWDKVGATAKDHLFIDEAAIAPAPAIAGDATEAELRTYIGTLSVNDVFAFYTGTSTLTDDIKFIFHVDENGSILKVFEPTKAKSRVHLDDTSVAPFSAGNADVSEVKTYLDGLALEDVFAYYTGNDTATDPEKIVYYVDIDGVATLLKNQGSIYSENGTLTSNRTLDGSTSFPGSYLSLAFANLSKFTVGTINGAGSTGALEVEVDKSKLSFNSGTESGSVEGSAVDEKISLKYATTNGVSRDSEVSATADGVLLKNTQGKYQVGEDAATLPTKDSDADQSIVTIDETTNLVGIKGKDAVNNIVRIAATPVDGTTVAYFVDQTFLVDDGTVYKATAKSTDPDIDGTGSTFEQIELTPAKPERVVFTYPAGFASTFGGAVYDISDGTNDTTAALLITSAFATKDLVQGDVDSGDTVVELNGVDISLDVAVVSTTTLSFPYTMETGDTLVLKIKQ